MSLTITVSLFLSEENSINCKSSTSAILFLSPPNIILFIAAVSLFVKWNPCALAVLTNSILSGETQMYSSSFFSFSSTLHVWHKDKANQNDVDLLGLNDIINFSSPADSNNNNQ